MKSSRLRRLFAVGLIGLLAMVVDTVLAPAGLEILSTCSAQGNGFVQFGTSGTQTEQYGGIFLPTGNSLRPRS